MFQRLFYSLSICTLDTIYAHTHTHTHTHITIAIRVLVCFYCLICIRCSYGVVGRCFWGLCVRCWVHFDTFGFQFGAQFPEVVDFAVVTQHVTLVRRDHRLMSGQGKVDDRQSPMPQSDVALDPMPLTVRSAMLNGIGHPLKRGWRNGFVVEMDDASDATHN